MEGREREGRGKEIYTFGSKDGRGGEGSDFNCKYVWFMKGGEG
jgi:hypothetical protein